METVVIGLRRQTSVIAALIMREIRLRNSRYAFAYLFDLFELLGMIIVMSSLRVFVGSSPMLGDSEILFIASGLIPISLFRTVSTKSAAGVSQSRGGKALPGVSLLDSAIAKSCVELFNYTVLAILLLTVLWVFDVSMFAVPYDMAPLLECWSVLYLFGLGVGLINSVIIPHFPLWNIFWGVLTRGQILLGAVYNVPEYMQPYIRNIIVWNPIAHLVALFRTGIFPGYPGHFIDIGYATLCAAVTFVVGLAVQRTARRRLASI
ncbi:ABC transporter permease [Oharaeibacter diazotrophicus]|uniref:Capsular polysaccharide transport system permease protein n=1 Tax=Oharaeibacter diazotrophicus TaxID=1920512 RepID=A0A4V3CVB6_9HYPH|nr:hypothetical protein [Oharaeibacter diazotrophicus]TDP81878.1 capsular polysaccharide transport system permease protein [Oharaeibacter diazotrophicus]BBE73510.1 polysialic acid transport protein KpsM [Pleomorphomonas sp. SM30]GLS75299.1 transport permease protein [Oharaeibacter diazotrophicus]